MIGLLIALLIGLVILYVIRLIATSLFPELANVIVAVAALVLLIGLLTQTGWLGNGWVVR